jgi:hypothetical protein
MFFGEHLINSYNNTIAIVESEKQLVLWFDIQKTIWIAAGSLNGLNESKMEICGIESILYPDLGVNGVNGSPFWVYGNQNVVL